MIAVMIYLGLSMTLENFMMMDLKLTKKFILSEMVFLLQYKNSEWDITC